MTELIGKKKKVFSASSYAQVGRDLDRGQESTGPNVNGEYKAYFRPGTFVGVTAGNRPANSLIYPMFTNADRLRIAAGKNWDYWHQDWEEDTHSKMINNEWGDYGRPVVFFNEPLKLAYCDDP